MKLGSETTDSGGIINYHFSAEVDGAPVSFSVQERDRIMSTYSDKSPEGERFSVFAKSLPIMSLRFFLDMVEDKARKQTRKATENEPSR